MRNKFAAPTLVVLVILAIAMIVPAPAAGQATVSLLEQLNAQYKLVKMGADSHGPAVVEAGTILAIQKGGILGVPYGDTSILSTKYQDGTVHSPNALLSKGIGFGMKKFGKEQNTHLFPVGDKVYPSHIDVNVPKDGSNCGTDCVAVQSVRVSGNAIVCFWVVGLALMRGSLVKL